MHYVYLLTDESGQAVYCGHSKNPKQRFYDHTRRKPAKGHGAFYGRKDLSLKIVGAKATNKEAWWLQVQWQRALGLEDDYSKLRDGVTFESCSKGGKTRARNQKKQQS